VKRRDLRGHVSSAGAPTGTLELEDRS
jgi:hypothetical protein